MIVIIPLGEVNGNMPAELIEPLAKSFNQAVKVGLPLPLPAESLDLGRGQYQADIILDFLPSTKMDDRELGIVDVDLYGFGLNFIFGEADVQDHKGIISLNRLKPEFYGLPPDARLFESRTLKEAIHELGHTYGLKHCPNSRCVMHFSNALEDTDIKSTEFCPLCHKKIKAKFF